MWLLVINSVTYSVGPTGRWRKSAKIESTKLAQIRW